MRIEQLIIWLAILFACSGCVRRRMTVRSNPPGAVVYIDDQEIGQTPVSTSFVYYGTRKIRLEREGYETLTVLEKVSPPWYQIPPFDFISENLYPREIRDERIVDVEMEPLKIVPRHELVGRANDLRTATRAGYAVPSVPDTSETDDIFPEDAYLEPDNSRYPPPFYPE